MKPGTFLWAMEQLIAGKKITYEDWPKDEYLCIVKERILDERDNAIDLSVFEPNDDAWIIWTPPVNYIPGTFPWAWEQLKAGKKVKRPTMGYPIVSLSGKSYKIMTSELSHTIFMMEVSDINATDWEVVE